MVLFLLGLVLQIALGYSPLQAGASLLPITAIMLVFSARSGRAPPQRIGPRWQMSIGRVVVAAGNARARVASSPAAATSPPCFPGVVIFAGPGWPSRWRR